MIKTGNILMVSGSTAAILSACGYDGQPVIGGIVFLIGLALLGTGNKLKKIQSEREKVNFRCRLKRKIAPSDSLARTGAID
uniref:Lipoprotein n=1 Tax=Myoviridae sp. ctvns3 TaxID=2825204 RepID=A0A8S5PCC4_9CAUD|nr:MAG TPA: hypothetical protein [Myoviridae sp. ctvns3]